MEVREGLVIPPHDRGPYSHKPICASRKIQTLNPNLIVGRRGHLVRLLEADWLRPGRARSDWSKKLFRKCTEKVCAQAESIV